MVQADSMESLDPVEEETNPKPKQIGNKRKSLYDDDALVTMQRQAKEAELPFYDNDENSDSQSQSSFNSKGEASDSSNEQ